MITNQAAPVIQAQGIRTPLGSVCACIRYEGLSKGPTAAQTGPFSTHVTSFKSFKHTYAGRDREQLFFQAVFSDSLFQADKARCSHFAASRNGGFLFLAAAPSPDWSHMHAAVLRNRGELAELERVHRALYCIQYDALPRTIDYLRTSRSITQIPGRRTDTSQRLLASAPTDVSTPRPIGIGIKEKISHLDSETASSTNGTRQDSM
ncbi:hypothetical protein J7T55_010332 [Diaporthe amygdali]|uniref:uncharacterized protein n=1 Tax=Phomopsis amygdali TaxID=1214568 RepID=UPI0022FE0A5A|nr:uncharacterized protein J7T55_010332 [Diaporthe amygdali]KAJ0107725.1 hypothetical protein J7T55_010332 [Diaporthe amygdali]